MPDNRSTASMSNTVRGLADFADNAVKKTTPHRAVRFDHGTGPGGVADRPLGKGPSPDLGERAAVLTASSNRPVVDAASWSQQASRRGPGYPVEVRSDVPPIMTVKEQSARQKMETLTLRGKQVGQFKHVAPEQRLATREHNRPGAEGGQFVGKPPHLLKREIVRAIRLPPVARNASGVAPRGRKEDQRRKGERVVCRLTRLH